MQRPTTPHLVRRLTGQDIALAAVAGSIVFWAGILHLLLA